MSEASVRCWTGSQGAEELQQRRKHFPRDPYSVWQAAFLKKIRALSNLSSGPKWKV
jgi:hypothetical protein